jgi:Zn-dependent protease
MNAQIKLGRIAGIQIGLHYSWFIIALLITMSLASNFYELNPQWGPGVIWATAIATGLLFFAAIVAHELSHAAVAKARKLPVRSITLFALGGVAQIEKESNEATTEFLMGIAGPIMSGLIGFLCLALALVLGWNPAEIPDTPLPAMLKWLGYINIGLAVFNMVPGFPLDGGRVFRAIVWWITGNAVRATRIAARVGQVVAFLFIIVGIFRFFGGGGIGGLWIAFIGWFLLEAASSSRRQVEANAILRGMRAGDLIERNCMFVDGRESLERFVNEVLLRTGRNCFLVRAGDGIEGMITADDIIRIDRSRWPSTTIEQAMQPVDRTPAVKPDTPVSEAMEIMSEKEVNELPVVRNGRFEGLITLGGVVRLLQTRAALGM